MVQNTCGQEGTAALAAPGGDSGFFLTGLHHGAEHLRPSQPSPEAKGPTEPPASDSSGRDSPAASESASEDGGDDLLTGEDVLGGEDPSPGDTADAAGRSEGEDEVVESAQTARRAELESYLRELRGKAEPAGSAPALLPEVPLRPGLDAWWLALLRRVAHHGATMGPFSETGRAIIRPRRQPRISLVCFLMEGVVIVSRRARHRTSARWSRRSSGM
mmetsp:Transcript_25624/g.60966  ORF Transcript_25624/g.60966 Transcript_25624/m.60966 type:complete len:217 (-) Transcript_25624:3504-4154(-)